MSQVLPVSAVVTLDDTPYSPISPKRSAAVMEEGEIPMTNKLARPRTKIVPITVSTRHEALALHLAPSSTRVFNGVNYDSFASPVFVTIKAAQATSGVSKYGKILFNMDDDALDAFNAVLSVCAAESPEGYAFIEPGDGLDQNTIRFKWNAPKTKKCSIMVRGAAANTMPLQGDRGFLVVEVSGLYRNDALKTCGLVSRIVSFALIQ